MTLPFDPNAYANMQVDGSFETQYTPIPAAEYPAQIDSWKLETVKFTDKTTGAEEFRLVCRLNWEIIDDAVKAALNMNKVTVKQDIFVDLTPTGAFDMSKNKNVELGRVREALNQNQGPWSFSMLQGGLATIKIGHRADKTDST